LYLVGQVVEQILSEYFWMFLSDQIFDNGIDPFIASIGKRIFILFLTSATYNVCHCFTVNRSSDSQFFLPIGCDTPGGWQQI
jgi:hypothetical protein